MTYRSDPPVVQEVTLGFSHRIDEMGGLTQRASRAPPPPRWCQRGEGRDRNERYEGAQHRYLLSPLYPPEAGVGSALLGVWLYSVTRPTYP